MSSDDRERDTWSIGYWRVTGDGCPKRQSCFFNDALDCTISGLAVWLEYQLRKVQWNASYLIDSGRRRTTRRRLFRPRIHFLSMDRPNMFASISALFLRNQTRITSVACVQGPAAAVRGLETNALTSLKLEIRFDTVDDWTDKTCHCHSLLEIDPTRYWLTRHGSTFLPDSIDLWATETFNSHALVPLGRVTLVSWTSDECHLPTKRIILERPEKNVTIH